ncbi:MAG: N-acetylneuraminate synthase [Acidimicrobiaceae bacterium]|nr:N-acetylneuraminate synthase [Acidimicrobiaceae bacterium]|tara:strand:+ start:332 stop:1402 length:1071 start_codon:yes stop_codon:yes gene_type:complete
MLKFKINKKIISKNSKTYFIADIAANHDGSLSRAKKLIKLCAKAGADAAKFQHFKAETIVLDEGFKKVGKIDHQSSWNDSVYNIYKKASINPKWTKELVMECKKNKIDFLTAAYDLDYVDELNKFLPAYKIGSGDITWREILVKIAKKNKPVILATGASNFEETKQAVRLIKKYNKKLVLMQCNTNYTNSNENFNYINLYALKQFKDTFGEKIVLGLSDHTKGHSTVLGSIALGARVIEKHFTDNNDRLGPDHKFSMNPKTWREMVEASRDLEKSLGNGNKKLEKNEIKSVIIQRRGVWARNDLKKNHKIKLSDLKFLRPCLKNSISPFNINKYLGKKLKKNIKKNNIISISCLNS